MGSPFTSDLDPPAGEDPRVDSSRPEIRLVMRGGGITAAVADRDPTGVIPLGCHETQPLTLEDGGLGPVFTVLIPVDPVSSRTPDGASEIAKGVTSSTTISVRDRGGKVLFAKPEVAGSTERTQEDVTSVVSATHP